MDEQTAITKWCPYVGLVKANEALTGNATGTNYCIASDCMMWRTDTEPTKWRKLDKDYYVPAEFGHGGYCGLGGK